MADFQPAADRTTEAYSKPSNAVAFKAFKVWQVQIWQFWEALKNSFLNILRYLIIAGLFVYLLTAVILLNDIMAFHDRVKSDVGDDARARRAVLMLHKMHDNPDKYPIGDVELPVGTLAVSLGSLKSNYADLTRFSRFNFVQPEDDPGSGKAAAQSSGSRTLPAADRKRFERLQETMLQRAETFDRYLMDNDSLVKIKRAINRFKENQKDLSRTRQETTSPPDLRLASLEDDVAELRTAVVEAFGHIPAHDLSKKVQNRLNNLVHAVSVPDDVHALKTDIRGLDIRVGSVITAIETAKADPKTINGTPAAIDDIVAEAEKEPLPKDYLEDIQTKVSKVQREPIDPIEYSAELDWLKLDVQALKRALTAFPNSTLQRDRLSSSLTLIDLANAEPVNQASISAYAEELKALKTDIAEIGDALPIDAVVPELRKALHAMDRDLEAARKTFGSPPSAETADLPDVDRYLTHIEQALDRRFEDDFSIASSLVDDLDQLRGKLAVLATIRPSEYRDPNDELIRDEEAQEIFDTRLEAMKEDLDRTEAKLLKQGRVVALANVLEENENETAKDAKIKAAGILQDFDSLNRFGWLMMPLPTLSLVSARSPWAEFGLNPLRLATLTTPSITTIYVLIIGAIGSLIYITKYQLKLVVDGHLLRMRPPRPLPWFLFRPIFGVVVALALYFLIRAGQLALGTGADEEVGTTLNIPILSVLALFAGILSWQALAMIETRGSLWFRAQTREPLWATGLSNALRTREKSIAECAQQIGRTQEQVGRWLSFQDKVPIELQDRLSTWIDMRLDELFGEFKPTQQVAGKAMWAVGLKQALDSYDRQIDAEALVELLREDNRSENIERIRGWITLRRQVPPATQWRLVDLLDVPHHLLFAPEKQQRDVWGTRLRRAIEDRKERTQRVALRMGIDRKQLHAWKELDEGETIPPVMQKRLMTTLERTFTDLFEAGDLDDKDMFAVPFNMHAALEKRRIDRKAFAHKVDVEVERVERWCDEDEDKRGRIARPTRERIDRVLKEYGPGPDPFERPPAELTDRQNDGGKRQKEPGPRPPAFATGLAKVMERQKIEDARTLAERLYGSAATPDKVKRVQSWIDLQTKVSRPMQHRLIMALRTTEKTLFS